MAKIQTIKIRLSNSVAPTARHECPTASDHGHTFDCKVASQDRHQYRVDRAHVVYNQRFAETWKK